MEWFRGRERYKRWQEEELILRREAASVIFDFEHRRLAWTERSAGTHAQFNAGYCVYCLKQADPWLKLRVDAFNRMKGILKVSFSILRLISKLKLLQKTPAVAICTRALNSFS